ncbi:hypothetical protein DI392_04145 [Vibrio albus]|uniref:Uncharacterized protein n=1 Tax=Vibrio albus TaxID=2200953 RepID=A0A2U3BBY8_9VIBR|nr:hypothetical protein [Vibrio albus]PWI34311.1 hypothetical protein DI392_04145 [Vibrio albus]
MRRNSKTYRLQLIKESVKTCERRTCSDPMVRFIQQLMEKKTNKNKDNDKDMNLKHRFAGHHYDPHAGGWVSDKW